MHGRQSRRRFLAAVTGVLAGCGAWTSDSDGDIRIENWDRMDHSVTVVLDRGDAYDTAEHTVSVEADSVTEIGGAVQQSDWPYPFYLHISVDGEYRTTTTHVWEETTEVVVRTDGSVIADETDRQIDLTPAEPPPGGIPTDTRAETPTR